MNDRLKYRVWFNKSKRYAVNKDDIVLFPDGVVGQFDIIGCYDEKDVTVEQCTGLKDKNGKLIYEGDIVETQGIKKIVKYNQSSCCFVFHNIGTIISHHIEDSWLNEFPTEIIGNIHENADLLELKQDD